MGARGGGDTAPTSYPAAALGELRRTWLNPMLRGPIRPEFWSGVVYATCVTLLGQQRGSAGVRAWCAAAEAALRWRISPAQAVGRRQCSGMGVTGSVSMRKDSAGQNKGRAWLCCAVVRSATADPRWVRRRGTGVRCSGPWGLLQATKAGLKGRGEGGEAQHGRWRGAEGSTAMSGDKGGAVRVDGAAGVQLRAPGLHGSTHEAPAKPRGGQRGRSGTGSDDARARRRSTGGGDEQWRIGRKKQRRRIYTPGQRYRVKNTTGTYVILRYRLLTHPVPLASLRYRFLAHPVP